MRQMGIEELEGVEVPFVQEVEVDQAGVEAVEGRRKLSLAESQRFEVYEAAIEASFMAHTAGVLAAEQVRVENLWESGWDSFEAYCLGRWDVSQDTMNRRIRAARVIKNLEEHVLPAVAGNGVLKEHVLPNTRQAVELAKLKDPEQQRQVWEQVTTGGEPVTAKLIEAAVQARKECGAPSEREAFKERAHQLAAQVDEYAFAGRPVGTAHDLVNMPGLPPDRAIAILENLLSMAADRSRALLFAWQSDDERERKTAFAIMQDKHPPADPRRLILQSLLEEMAHCRDLFPGDPLFPEFAGLVSQSEALVAAIIAQEEERYNATITL